MPNFLLDPVHYLKWRAFVIVLFESVGFYRGKKVAIVLMGNIRVNNSKPRITSFETAKVSPFFPLFFVCFVGSLEEITFNIFVPEIC